MITLLGRFFLQLTNSSSNSQTVFENEKKKYVNSSVLH